MKKTIATKNEKAQKRNDKAAKILRSLDDKQLAEVAGGACRTCGLVVSLESLAK